MKPSKKKTIKSAVKAGAKKPAVKTASVPVKKSTPAPQKTAKSVVKAAKSAAPEKSTSSSIESVRQEVASLRTQLSRHMAPVTTGSMEEVDAMRRVLNDLMEARLNDVIRELVTIRNTSAAAGPEARRVTEQMDMLLADLGAMKFEAERLEHVDPLIHSITREVADASLPDGVVMETIRPGFYTGRGFVVAKALVAVNRRH